MPDIEVRFSSETAEPGAFRLLELPPELCEIVEAAFDGSSSEPLNLSIKGHPTEDAVLTTAERTYAMRSVVLSNSVLVVSPPSLEEGEEGDVVIRDQLSEILELVKSVPRVERLGGVLRGREYGEDEEGVEGDEDEDEMDGIEEEEAGDASRTKRLTYEDARRDIQASEGELRRALRDRRILILNGRLRPISPSYLSHILQLILTALISLRSSKSTSTITVPAEKLISCISSEHGVKREVLKQVLNWFREVEEEQGEGEGTWKMDERDVLREVGVGILRAHKDKPIPQDQFMTLWRQAVGDAFESSVDLELLAGNYLANSTPTIDPTTQSQVTLTYFPASALPSDPAQRFADLFLTRPRWSATEIAPFLADIVVDEKERDKLLLKYARAVTSPEGIWYTARTRV